MGRLPRVRQAASEVFWFDGRTKRPSLQKTLARIAYAFKGASPGLNNWLRAVTWV